MSRQYKWETLRGKVLSMQKGQNRTSKLKFYQTILLPLLLRQFHTSFETNIFKIVNIKISYQILHITKNNLY